MSSERCGDIATRIPAYGLRKWRRGRDGQQPCSLCASRPAECTIALSAVLVAFVALEAGLPLSTSVKIGADEDFEPAKPVLRVAGYEMYSQVWDDQPPLYTYLIVQEAWCVPFLALT